jgi:uracil phosphoribosyltransferase
MHRAAAAAAAVVGTYALRRETFRRAGGSYLVPAAAAAAAVAACASKVSEGRRQEASSSLLLCKGSKEIFEPGQAIGEGLKSEIWKKKHQNVTVLELEEGSPVLPLLSHLRKGDTPPSTYSMYADRLMRALLEVAFMNLPLDEEAIFETGTGSQMQAPQLEDGVVIGVIMLNSDGGNSKHSVWKTAVRDTFPEALQGWISVTNISHLDKCEIPKNLEEASILLLSGEVGEAEPVLAALEALSDAGIEAENVSLVCPVISLEACNALTKEASDMQIIAGAVDPETGKCFDCRI